LRLARPLIGARRRLENRTPPPERSATETVSQWLSRHRQGDVLTEWLWEPLAVASLNQSVHHAAAAPFVRILTEMFSSDRSAAAIVLPTKPLHEAYAQPARDYIVSRGGEVRTAALARIVLDDRRVTGVEVRGERFDVPQVLSAVAWHALGNVFGGSPPTALAGTLADALHMESMPIVTVNLWYDRRVMDEPFAGMPGRTMQWVFDKRLAFGGTASHLSLVSSGAAAIASRPNGELTALAADEIRATLPGARDATVVRATVIREKRATFSLAPGQPRRPDTVTPIEGLFLAGDWTNTGLPATIEGAVISGHAAAKAILERS
jgi:hydroxysqualene dehydroxylase